MDIVRKPAPAIVPVRPVDHKCECEEGGQSCAKCAAEKQKPKKPKPDERQLAARRPPSPSGLRYDFARLRLRSGLAPDARCHAGEECQTDPLVDYQGSGTTTCDQAAGTMGSTVTEHCAGDCVAQHEAVHRRDRGPCCARVKACLDRATTDAQRTRCRLPVGVHQEQLRHAAGGGIDGGVLRHVA
jgi:hypothetical protein